MPDFHTVNISSRQLIQSNYIFRITVFYFQKICYFPVRFLRQIAAYLYINPFIPAYSYKINFLRIEKVIQYQHFLLLNQKNFLKSHFYYIERDK